MSQGNTSSITPTLTAALVNNSTAPGTKAQVFTKQLGMSSRKKLLLHVLHATEASDDSELEIYGTDILDVDSAYRQDIKIPDASASATYDTTIPFVAFSNNNWQVIHVRKAAGDRVLLERDGTPAAGEFNVTDNSGFARITMGGTADTDYKDGDYIIVQYQTPVKVFDSVTEFGAAPIPILPIATEVTGYDIMWALTIGATADGTTTAFLVNSQFGN